MTIWKVETMRMYFRKGATSETPGLPGRPLLVVEENLLEAAAPARDAGVPEELGLASSGGEVDNSSLMVPDIGPLKMAESSAWPKLECRLILRPVCLLK